MATHSSILAWRIPWTEESGLQSGVAESVMTEQQQLVVQQLKTVLPPQGTRNWIPLSETESLHAATKDTACRN